MAYFFALIYLTLFCLSPFPFTLRKMRVDSSLFSLILPPPMRQPLTFYNTHTHMRTQLYTLLRRSNLIDADKAL